MTEVITSSRDPDQRQRRPLKTPALLAALIAVISVLGFIATTHSHAGHRVHHPTSTPTVASSLPPAQPLPPSQPGPVAPAGLRCGKHCDRPVLRGRAGNGPSGLQLLVNTAPLTVLDATGSRHPGPRVPLARNEHVATLLPMGEEAVALVQENYLTDSSPLGRVYRLTPTGAVVQMGRADALIQGVGATVWTVTYPRHTATPGPFTLTELDPSGRELVNLSETDGTQVFRATRAGLLATLPARPTGAFLAPQTLVLLDPASGDVDHVLSNGVFAVLDATDTTVAWSSVQSAVEVYDLVRETSETVFHPRGYLPPDHGKFSPDQRTLALSVGGLPQIGTNPASYGYLQVLDLRTGRTTQINGLRFPPKIDPQLDWSHDSGVLILGVDDGKQGRIAFWHRGTRMVTVLAAAVPNSDYYGFDYLQLDAGQTR